MHYVEVKCCLPYYCCCAAINYTDATNISGDGDDSIGRQNILHSFARNKTENIFSFAFAIRIFIASARLCVCNAWGLKTAEMTMSAVCGRLCAT